MATWRDVSRFALALPQTQEEVSKDGRRSWTVKGKGFVWERPLRKSDLAALGIQTQDGPVLGAHTPDLELKDVLLKSNPKAIFTTPHFDGYAAVLIRLEKISARDLKDVIVEAWLTRAPKRLADDYLKGRS